MNCQDMARILDEQEVDSLLAEEKSGVQTHLNACSECARDWQIHAQLTSAAIPAVPVELRAQFSPQMVAASSGGGNRRNGLVAIGALVALAAAAATMLVQKKALESPVVAINESPQREHSATQVLSESRPSPAQSVSGANWKAMDDETDKWISSVTKWLAARDDADALLTAAILASSDSGPPPPEALELLKRATAKAPDSARIQATAMQLCFTSSSCDATPYERALRRIAPNNALGWELDVVRASRADDQEALRSALAAMSRARTYDLYGNAGLAAFMSHFRQALVPLPRFDGISPATFRDEFALDTFDTELPKLQNTVIQKFCKSVTDENVLADCHQVGAAMRAGDSITTNLVGIAISGYGLPADSAEARSLLQEERQIRWIGHAYFVEIKWIEDDDGIVDLFGQYPRLLEIIANHPRDIDVRRAVLNENGIPTEPPANWKCDNCGKGLGY